MKMEVLDAGVLAEYRRDPRQAISESGVVCLECGRSFRHLTNTHLRAHGMTSGEYKQRFGYNLRRALMAGSVREVHTDNARKSGLAFRIRRRPILEDIELRRMGGRHRHALEETLTRQERCPCPSPDSQIRDHFGRFASGQMPDAGLESVAG